MRERVEIKEPVETPPEQTPLDAQSVRLARMITLASILGWSASMFLPGFIVESQTKPWFGWQILLMGLLFGWATGGFAVYANLFYPFVAGGHGHGNGWPKSTLLMVLLGLTIVFFPGVPRDEGTGTLLPVVSWGVGAVVWFVSILLAGVASGIYLRLFRRRVALAMVTLLGMSVIGLAPLHLIQRYLANEQEREIYLSNGMVFSVAEFCGIPLVWPERTFLAHDDTVTLDVEESLASYRAGSPYLWLPRLNKDREGNAYRPYNQEPATPSSDKGAQPSGLPSRYTLQVRRTDHGAVIRLIDERKQAPVYEQPLRAMSRNQYGYARFCPGPTRYWTGSTKGYDTAILRAIGRE